MPDKEAPTENQEETVVNIELAKKTLEDLAQVTTDIEVYRKKVLTAMNQAEAGSTKIGELLNSAQQVSTKVETLQTQANSTQATIESA